MLAANDLPTSDIVLWSSVLILTVVGLFVFITFYRKWMNAPDTTTGPAFTLSDLRKLHKEGKMTTEEYEKAKAAIIGSLKPSPPPAKSNPSAPPPRRPEA